MKIPFMSTIATVLFMLLGYPQYCQALVEPKVSSVEEANKWVYQNIEYVAHNDNVWRSPSATLRLRKGVCRDMALLVMKIAYDSIGASTRLVLLKPKKGDLWHAIVEYAGKYFDPTNGLSGTAKQIYWNDYFEESVYYYYEAKKLFSLE